MKSSHDSPPQLDELVDCFQECNDHELQIHGSSTPDVPAEHQAACDLERCVMSMPSTTAMTSMHVEALKTALSFGCCRPCVFLSRPTKATPAACTDTKALQGQRKPTGFGLSVYD